MSEDPYLTTNWQKFIAPLRRGAYVERTLDNGIIIKVYDFPPGGHLSEDVDKEKRIVYIQVAPGYARTRKGAAHLKKHIDLISGLLEKDPEGTLDLLSK